MDRNNPTTSRLISILTFGSLFPILFFRITDPQGTIFWFYSVLMTGFIILTYVMTKGYVPKPDVGYRPEVSVIIPAKDEEEAIEETLARVFRADYPVSKLEVIAVDDGSTDRTWDRLQKVRKRLGVGDRLTLIRNAGNKGKRAAMAIGVRKARGEILVCIDSDSFVDRDAIKLLVQPFTDPTVVGVCGHGAAANSDEGVLPKLQHYWYQVMFRIFKGMESRFASVTCCSGLLSAYRRNMVLAVLDDWLNQTFMGRPMLIGDDRELTNLVLKGTEGKFVRSSSDGRLIPVLPLSARNAKVVYQSNAVAYTIVPTKLPEFLRQQLRWKRSHIHGCINASKFMWRKPLRAAASFYLYQFLVYMSTIVSVIWLVVRPLQGDALSGLVFLAGNMYVAFLSGLNVWKLSKAPKEAIPYTVGFVFISVFLSLTVLIYGWLTPWKGGWITRTAQGTNPEEETLSHPTPLIRTNLSGESNPTR